MGEERNKQLAVIELAEKDWIRPVGVNYRSQRTLLIVAQNLSNYSQLIRKKPKKLKRIYLILQSYK
jgi:hypothetical protein